MLYRDAGARPPDQPFTGSAESLVGGVQVQHLAVGQCAEAGVLAAVPHVLALLVVMSEPLVDPVDGDVGVDNRCAAHGDLGVGPVHGGLVRHPACPEASW